jgi:hypothetical protein
MRARYDAVLPQGYRKEQCHGIDCLRRRGDRLRRCSHSVRPSTIGAGRSWANYPQMHDVRRASSSELKMAVEAHRHRDRSRRNLLPLVRFMHVLQPHGPPLLPFVAITALRAASLATRNSASGRVTAEGSSLVSCSPCARATHLLSRPRPDAVAREGAAADRAHGAAAGPQPRPRLPPARFPRKRHLPSRHPTDHRNAGRAPMHTAR